MGKETSPLPVTKVSHSEIAADLSRLHNLLSFADGDPYEYNDLCFEAAVKRRLKDPSQVRQLRQIASQVSMLVSD
jgi:hypothetical protein